MTNNDIREFLGLERSNREFDIKQVDMLGSLSNTLMFINKLNLDLTLYCTGKDSVYLIDESYPEFSSTESDIIRVKNPKYKFCLIVEKFNLPSMLQLATNNLTVIGERCKIDDTVIIGEDFSPVMGDDQSKLVEFPQLGGVIIGDDVVIKYHSMIGKGTFGFTRIGDNTMIDYGCQIGHNCVIGKSCIIAAGTIIGGSTVVGNGTVIGMGAKIRNGLHIGENVSIGMGSVVIKDIPNNCVVVGNPARIIEHKKIFDERGLV